MAQVPIQHRLEAAHRHAASASGRLSMMLAKRNLNLIVLKSINDTLQDAMHEIKKLQQELNNNV